MSAWDWVRACHEPTLADVFPGQLRDSDIPAVFESALHDPDFDRRCHLAARAALERATGREWWWAYNLIGEARSGWIVVNGRLMLAGISAHDTNIADWLDAAFVSIMMSLDESGQKRLESRLRKIPAGVAARPKMSSKADLLAFARE